MQFKIEIRITSATTEYEFLDAESQEAAEQLAAEKFEGHKNDGMGGYNRSEVISVEEDED